MGPLRRLFLPNHTALCVRSLLSSPKETDSLSHGSNGSTSRPSVIRPRREQLQQRTCWQALYILCQVFASGGLRCGGAAECSFASCRLLCYYESRMSALIFLQEIYRRFCQESLQSE